MTTSRDEALKLARMHVSGEAYGRLVAGDAYVLARALIAEARRAREYRDALTKQRMYAVATGKLTTPSAMHAMMQRMVDDIDDALLRREDERG